MMPVKSKTKKVETKEKAVKNTPSGLGHVKNTTSPSAFAPPSYKTTDGHSKASADKQSSPQLRRGGDNLDVVVYNQDGQEAGKVVLPKEIFGLKINSDLVAQAVRAQLANTRQHIAHAKDRSEVRGGGKKPWKQKGTGRARHASIRSPLWAGGGVTFGPRKEKNFSVKINKKMKRQALFMVLSGKLRDGELIILDDLKLKQAKTKAMAEAIKKIKAGTKKDLLKGAMIVLPKKDETILRAARNLSKVSMIGVDSLNVIDLLSVKYLLMSKATVEKIKTIYQK